MEGEDYLGEIKKMTPFSHIPIPTKNNSRIDAIATYSSAITLVLFFGVSVLKIAKYGMNTEKCARFN